MTKHTKEIKNNFNPNGKTIASFVQVCDRQVGIVLEDGTDIVIRANTRYVYDEDEGFIHEPFLEIEASV